MQRAMPDRETHKLAGDGSHTHVLKTGLFIVWREFECDDDGVEKTLCSNFKLSLKHPNLNTLLSGVKYLLDVSIRSSLAYTDTAVLISLLPEDVALGTSTRATSGRHAVILLDRGNAGDLKLYDTAVTSSCRSILRLLIHCL